jgi:transcription initiation factor TFIIB
MNESTVERTGGEEVAEAESTGADETSQRGCPECGGRVRRDQERGETACDDCGIVLDEDIIDRGPEWRSFEGESSTRSRVGAPVTQRKHDSGLSTTIGRQDRDAQGRALSGRQRRKMRRLRTWDERFRTKDAQERNLKQALGEIERMASALGLPENVRETASVIYRRAVEAGLLPGRSIEGMATASLYGAARRQGSPRTLVECAAVSRVEKLPIQRAYRYLSRELGLAIEPADPLQYVPQVASALDIPEEAERVARDLLETGKRQGVHSGKHPAGLAAAAIYAAARLTNTEITQATVSHASNVSTVTIRNRYQELLEVRAEQGR